jgi:hypothetical protein
MILRTFKNATAAILASALALGMAACGSPYISATKTSTAPVVTSTAVSNTKFSAAMIFDAYRTYSDSAKTCRVYNLAAPYDDSAARGTYIPEITSGSTGYIAGAYIKLVIATSDGDSITAATLELRRADDTIIRTISAGGSINYLGSEGFVYISTLQDYGYFFSSKDHAYGDELTYTVSVPLVTKLSQLNW